MKELGLTVADFERIMALPIKTYRDYPTYQNASINALRNAFVACAKVALRTSRRLRGLPPRSSQQ